MQNLKINVGVDSISANEEDSNVRLKEAVVILLLTIGLCISSHIKIPIQPVPITLQTFMTALTALAIRNRKAVIPTIIYMIYGLGGAFVFTNGGGIWYLLSPTFGYILGFIAMAFVMGILLEKTSKINALKTFSICMLGTIICHIFGVVYMYTLLHKTITVASAISTGLLIFMPLEVIKMVVATAIVKINKSR
jgi:biotin transport system substrate-specific component